MERTVIQGYYKTLTLHDLSTAESCLKKEELNELNAKSNEIIGNMLHINSVETRALMEKMFKLGYLAAHIIPGEE